MIFFNNSIKFSIPPLHFSFYICQADIRNPLCYLLITRYIFSLASPYTYTNMVREKKLSSDTIYMLFAFRSNAAYHTFRKDNDTMKLTLITIGILILFLYILILYCCILVGARSERHLRQFLENRNPSQDDHSISG